MTRKPGSHVRILTFRTDIGYSFPKVGANRFSGFHHFFPITQINLETLVTDAFFRTGIVTCTSMSLSVAFTESIETLEQTEQTLRDIVP